MAEERKKTTRADLERWQAEHIAAEVEKRRQAYQTEYERGEQVLPWGLKIFLNQLSGLNSGDLMNELLKVRGDVGVVQQRHPDAIPAIVGLISRELKLSPPTVTAVLGLPPLPRDALDTLLLAVVRERAHEARNGLLPLSLVVAEVNAGCGLNGGLTPKFIGGRLHMLGYVLTNHHPAFVVVISRLLPSEADTAHTRLLPAPEEPRACEHTENGSHTQ